MDNRSASFVKQALNIIADNSLSSETAQRLRDWIERVKEGKDVVVSDLTDKEIIARCV